MSKKDTESKTKQVNRSYIWEVQSRVKDDEGNEIFTKEMIDKYIEKQTSRSKKSIQWYAWIVHDKDVYTEQDKLEAHGNPTKIKIGGLKPPHIHLILKFQNSRRQTDVANAFHLDKHFVRKPTVNTRGIQLPAMVTYLTHEREPLKARYSRELIYTSHPDLLNEMIDKYEETYPKKLSKQSRRKLAEMYVEEITRGNISLAQIKEQWGFNFYLDYEARFLKARHEYIRTKFEMKPRINYFIEGKSGVGKSTVARMLAFALGKRVFAKELNQANHDEHDFTEDEMYLEVGERKVRFDAYEYQPTLIWNDVRSKDLLNEFGREGVLNLLELNPVKRNYNIKYGGVILSNQVNVINGIEDCDTFIGGLTEAYTDASGVEHAGEDKKQAYRRFPVVLHIHQDYIEIKINTMIFDIKDGEIFDIDYEKENDEYYTAHRDEYEELVDSNKSPEDIAKANVDVPNKNVVRTESCYQTYKIVKVNISKINEGFAYDAWNEIAMRIMEPVVKIHKKYMDSHQGKSNKIVNAQYIPDIEIISGDDVNDFINSFDNSVDSDNIYYEAKNAQDMQWNAEMREAIGESRDNGSKIAETHFELYSKFRELYEIYEVKRTYDNFLDVENYLKINYDFLIQFPIIKEFVEKGLEDTFIKNKDDYLNILKKDDEIKS